MSTTHDENFENVTPPYYRRLEKVEAPSLVPLALAPPSPLVARGPPGLYSLNHEARAGLPTEEAAAHLGRKPQTLRAWACYGNGPIQPRRIAGRLLWMVPDLKRLLGV